MSLQRQKNNLDDKPNPTMSGFVPDPSDIEAADKFENFASKKKQIIFPWIKDLTPKNWHYLILGWNYDWPLGDVLAWILAHPDCDKGTAQIVLARNMMEVAEYKFDEEDKNILFFLTLCKAASERLYSGSYTQAQFQPFHQGKESEYLRDLEINERHYLRNPDHYSLEFKKEFFLPA